MDYEPGGPSGIDLAVASHISTLWPDRGIASRAWTRGKIAEAIPEFRVLEVAPQHDGGAWVYASCGAWRVPMSSHHHLEFMLFSPLRADENVETLAMVAAMHSDERYRMYLNAIVNIGRPWLPGSLCDHLLIAPLYMLEDGEEVIQVDGIQISYLWLIPVTANEAEFGRQFGGGELGEVIGRSDVDVFQIDRPSIVE